jgi:hypothetical protein
MSRVRLLLALAILALVHASLAACGDDALPNTVDPVATDFADTTPVDTTSVDTARSEDTAGPEDTTPLDGAEVDSAVPPPTNPFDAPDPSPPFLPEPEPPPEPLACPPLTNAGAELGDLFGWRVDSGSFIASGGGPVAFEGDFSFRAGTAPHSLMSQELPLGALVAPGRVALLRLMVRSHGGKDEAWFALRALDADGVLLAERRNGPYLNDDWRDGEVALALPPTTARLAVVLEGIRQDGNSNDAFFDDVGVCVFAGEPQAIVADLPGPPYLMNVGPDRVSVMFETRQSTTATVEYGTAPDALDRQLSETTAATTHVMRLTGLTPNTRYWYRVRFSDLRLAPFDFLTARAPDDDGRIELIMFADNQDGPAAFRKLAVQMAAHDPDLILHAGDVVQNGTRWDYRETFFSPYFGLGNRAAVLLGAGNHETYSSGILPSAAARALWEEYVDQPGDEHCFGVRWGSLFVVVIDTEKPHGVGSDQYGCIEDALGSAASREATFRVAVFHRPPLIEYWDSFAGEPSEVTFFTFGMDAPDVRYYLAPLFERLRVQLVFNGHNHLYQFVRRWPSFTAWVTSGGGGGILESGVESARVNDWSPFIDERIFGRHHFLRVIIENRRMWVRAIGDRGDTLHEFQVDP